MTILVSADEYVKFIEYQKSWNESTTVTNVAESGEACLISSADTWIIDSGATDYVTGNPNIRYSFQSHEAPSPMRVADGSTLNIVGSRTVKPTSSITLSYVLSVPKLGH